MGSAYTILGRQVPAHWISIATLTTAVGGAIISSSGSSESVPKTAAAPAVVAEKADDIDVEKLLNDFLKDNEEKK